MIRNLEIHRGILYGEENQKPVSYVLTNQTQDMLHAQAELEMASQLFTDYEKRYEQEKKELKLQSFKAKLSIISVVLTTVVCLLIARVLPYHYLFFLADIALWMTNFVVQARINVKSVDQYNRALKNMEILKQGMSEMHVKKIEQENILKWLSEQKEVKLQVPSLELQNKYAYQLQKSLDELEISYIKRSLEMPSYSNSNRKQKTL